MQSLWDALKRVEGKIKHLHICTKISKNNIKKTISIAMPDPKMMDQTCKCTWLRYLFCISRSNVWRNVDFSPLGRWAPLWDQQRTTNSDEDYEDMKGTYSNHYCHFFGGVAQPFLARGVEQADIVTLGEHWTIAFLKRFGPRVEVGWSSLLPQPWRSVYVHNIHPLWGSNWIWSDHVALPRPFFRFRIFRANLMQPAPKPRSAAGLLCSKDDPFIPTARQRTGPSGLNGRVCVQNLIPSRFFLTLVDFACLNLRLILRCWKCCRHHWKDPSDFHPDRLPFSPTNIPCEIQHASRCPDDRLDL